MVHFRLSLLAIGAWCCCNILHGAGATQIGQESMCKKREKQSGRQYQGTIRVSDDKRIT